MDIDFTAIGTVAGVGFVAAVGVVLCTRSASGCSGPVSRPTRAASDAVLRGDPALRAHAAGAHSRAPWLCFALCIAAVLCGIWMTIPQFH